MGQGHDHGVGNANSTALAKALGLTAAFLLAEVAGAYVFNSLALLSDAAHMLTDALALAVALVAIRVGRRPADRRRTWGYHRFEILAAAFNASLLFLVALYILYEAFQRFREPAEVGSLGMLAVAAFGLLVNWISMRLLAGGSESSLNVKSAYLEVWSDFLGSVAVIIGAGVIWATGWTWVDPLLGVAIAFWVLPRTWTLLSEAIDVLLESVPRGIDLDAVEQSMRGTAGVRDIHDLHVWALTSGKVALSAHVVVDASLSREERLEDMMAVMLREKFGITHLTVQAELAGAHDGVTEDRWGEPDAGQTHR
ncbi:cation diffusion facilitator family transporter [Pseudoroseomonas ludipueritiae]|uniref:Cation transporter n=1 Tax=Pseudoroseomonas ludipueritiae TaxID=198093 RepID=A0ABR7R2I7_9PROT|nr:cation diffusion facilitator family transporter [Pseudoroseomonas ludipueritiae]MBC9175945.1 cation transporter [Pseudoroseomonas ludipueritiae]